MIATATEKVKKAAVVVSKMICAILPLSALNLSASNDTLLALGKAPKSTIVVSVKVSIESPKKRACIPIDQSNKGWINSFIMTPGR